MSKAMHEDAQTALETAAGRYDHSADEPEAAANPLRTAARWFGERDVPRGCAHAFVAYGHMRAAQITLDDNAILHASKSLPCSPRGRVSASVGGLACH